MPTPKDAVLAFRDELLANRWPDDARVAELIGVPRDQDAVGHIRNWQGSAGHVVRQLPATSGH